MPKSRRLKSRKSSRRSKQRKSTKKYRKQRRHRSRINKGVKRVYMSGGYGPGAGPVGSSWGPNPNSWPNGGSGYDSKGNHFSPSPYGIATGGPDPAMPSNNLANLNYQSGGAFPFSQTIVDMGRSAMYGAEKLYSNITGSANDPVNPNVTEQEHLDQNYKMISYNPPDVMNDRIISDNIVARIN